MKRIYSVLVENRSGVLCKVAGLFSRRCFNIDSLAVGETDDHAVSCMTIVSSGDERTLEQIEKQLNKKLDVINAYACSYLTATGHRRFDYLPVGSTYVLVETTVPEGYAKADDRKKKACYTVRRRKRT